MIAPRFARLPGLALLAFAGLTVAAAAADQPATTSGYANLRSGPGTSYGVIDTLDPGTDLIVHACTGTWCAITTDSDADGFLAKSLIDFDSAPDSGPAPADDAEICFYQGPGFSDANFCVNPGDSDDSIPGSFNNAIESILISGGASIEVCTGPAMSGYCRTFDHSVQKLPSSLRDKITSYSADSGDDGETPPSDVPDSDSSIGFTLN
jgi:hypothetical protein